MHRSSTPTGITTPVAAGSSWITSGRAAGATVRKKSGSRSVFRNRGGADTIAAAAPNADASRMSSTTTAELAPEHPTTMGTAPAAASKISRRHAPRSAGARPR